MPKSSLDSRATLALFATLLVVLGVVAVAFVANPVVPAFPEKPAVIRGDRGDVLPSSVVLLAVDQSGARIILNGATKTLSWPDDAKLLGQPLSTLVGFDARSGATAYLASGFIRATSSAGLRSPDGRRSLHPAPAKRDGTGTVEVRLGNESRLFVLRMPNGRGIRDVTPVGWWDNETLAVAGLSTSSRAIFAVSLTDKLRQVATLPEAIQNLRMQNGELWYVTVTPGEGLEASERPPSALHRVSVTGLDAVVLHDDKHVIGHYAVADSYVAYARGEGAVRVPRADESKDIPLGKGKPFIFLVDGRILMSRDDIVFLKDPVTGREESVMTLAGDAAAVFVLPNAPVDEIREKI